MIEHKVSCQARQLSELDLFQKRPDLPSSKFVRVYKQYVHVVLPEAICDGFNSRISLSAGCAHHSRSPLDTAQMRYGLFSLRCHTCSSAR